MSNKERSRGPGPVTVRGSLGEQQKREFAVDKQFLALAGKAVLLGKDSADNSILLDTLNEARAEKRAKKSPNYFSERIIESGLLLCFFELTPDDESKSKAYAGAPVEEALEKRYFHFENGAVVKLTQTSGFSVLDPELQTKLGLWGKMHGQPTVSSLSLIEHKGFNAEASGTSMPTFKGRNPSHGLSD